jgi:hypothetical protein
MTEPETRLVHAAFDGQNVTVYQAYRPEIASAAVQAGTFVQPFSLSRMTWIKPSFGWMMYRSGWATKPGQERVLAIEIRRDGFEWALAHACLSHYDPGAYASRQEWASAKAESPVRVQWDPDRSLTGHRLPARAIQIGLSGKATRLYVAEWITSLTDITDLVHRLRDLVSSDGADHALTLIRAEEVYPLQAEVARRIGADPHPPHAESTPHDREDLR